MKTTESRDSREKQRIDDQRRLEERCAELDTVMNMKYKSPLHFDASEIPEGWEYYWGRESNLNEPDNSRAPELKMKGWTPVPASRHPSRVFEDFLDRSGHLKGYISHKGLVLFERPRIFGDRERERHAKESIARLHSMPGTEDFMSEPTMPGRFIGDQRPLMSRTF